jgi:hypothetical protein
VSFLLIYWMALPGARDMLADELPDHVIFTTAQTVSSGLGGLAAMDSRCQAKAQAAGLDGTWMAILSDSTADVIDRLAAAGADGPFFNTYRQGPQLVAADLAGLFDESLAATLFFDEFGDQMVSDSATWTATLADGTYSGSSYDDWRSFNGSSRVGRQLSTDSHWLDWFEQQGVHSHNLYCVRTDRSPVFSPPPPPIYSHLVFVSSALFNGDFGGLSGADAECQRLADAAGMDDRLWKAILSDSSVAARDRIRVHGPVYNLRGDFVAADLEDLFDGGNAAFIRFDENGGLRNDQLVWTGSHPDGSRYSAAGPGAYKQDWTSSQGATMIGGTLKMGSDWLQWHLSSSNGNVAPARA